ncbi:TetR/AcrR family transcriptional regulator [Defluviimonas sp. WL0002]|uniref:TetR/AcrR family transcriptional regulator n=1 Tax=Albidovulum marisflavi TaxID=2984159 RepID=A0ABT2ZCK9_9RHOB|nr:helix-turn-helix domain-containing protein [Defluviimonas sp. WL0002]MCV2868883.1 TetR/AcrR family transcriptional regulator [Defluviimonas sp. WL0002]
MRQPRTGLRGDRLCQRADGRVKRAACEPIGIQRNEGLAAAERLAVAKELLVSEGVAEVKVLAIGERLGVSRSSFYWYFKSRRDLMRCLRIGSPPTPLR